LEKNMKSLRNLLVPSLTIVAFLIAGTMAKADPLPLSLTIDSPFQTGGGGQTLTFTASVTNTDPTDTVYLNGASTTLTGPGSLTTNLTDFYIYSPFFLLPSTSSGDFDLFTVYIPYGTPYGLYTGDFEILGGGPSDNTDVGTANFDVEVTPEPSSFLLLGSGLLALAVLAKRKISV
jgi:hypothetical protein